MKIIRRRGYTDDEIKNSVNELTDKAGNQTDGLFQTNQAVYSLLRYGSSSVRNSKGQYITVHYVDWENISANDFYIAEEVSVLCRDGIHRKRPDLVFYINGIAPGICELKNSAVSVGEGIRQMLTNQKPENISRFFSTAQLLFAGNESQGIFYGTIQTPEKFYFQWREDKNATDALSCEIKNLHGNDNNRLRAGIISLCHKERFLSLIHAFTVFDGEKKKTGVI